MANTYGRTAVDAAKMCELNSNLSPSDAWRKSVVLHTSSKSSQEKGCPRSAFLGLCENGFIKGVTPRGTAGVTRNGQYAISAAQLLIRENEPYAHGPASLWRKVVGVDKKSNGQMQVVIALHLAGLLQNPRKV